MNIPTIEELQGHPLGLYDAHTDKNICADKVIDISELCKDAHRVLAMYARINDEEIVQIEDCYYNQNVGRCICYDIKQLTAKQLAEHEVFYYRALVHLGANPYQLANAIINNKP